MDDGYHDFLAGRAGMMQVVNYNLDLDLWGEDESSALLKMNDIYKVVRVTNSLKFELTGITVDFNQALVTLKNSYGAEDICLNIATAFAVATLQVCRYISVYICRYICICNSDFWRAKLPRYTSGL